MIPDREHDHRGTASALLTDAFRGKRVVEALLSAFSARVQELEEVFWDIITKRLLDNATAGQLDTLGRIVGEARRGREDDEYRGAIRLRIRVNRSQGTAEDVIQVLVLAVLGERMRYLDMGGGRFLVEVFAVTAVRSVIDLVAQARAAGTRGVIHHSAWPAAENMTWGSTVGSGPQVGFGDRISLTPVRRWVSAQELKR